MDFDTMVFIIIIAMIIPNGIENLKAWLKRHSVEILKLQFK